jgi:hypothetical protein
LAATSHFVYVRSLPNRLIEHVFGEESGDGWLTPQVILRKVYALVAFTLIGFVVHEALPPARRPALRAALVVGAFSALIEVLQKLHHAHEGLASNAFDILSGALGGWLAVSVAEAVARRRAESSRR